MNSLIDKKKKAEVLQRIKERKAPFCAEKPTLDRLSNPATKEQKKLNDELIEAAKSSRHIDEIQTLIEKGADVNTKDSVGWTVLIWMIGTSTTPTIEWLIGKGADINFRTSSGYTPLMRAAECGRTKTAEILIEKGADVNARDNNGLTALRIADANQNVMTAAVLVQNGAKK